MDFKRAQIVIFAVAIMSLASASAQELRRKPGDPPLEKGSAMLFVTPRYQT